MRCVKGTGMIVWIVLLRMLSRQGLGGLWVLLIRYLGCIVVSSRIFCNAIVKGVCVVHRSTAIVYDTSFRFSWGCSGLVRV